jgi:predicted MFS family arabinose efflux permease
MLFYPDVALMLTFSSLLYVEYYWVLTTYSTLLKENYGYNEIQIGLCYLPNGIGAMVTSFCLGKFLNWDYVRSKKKLGFNPKDKVSLEGFPIEKVRLRIMPYIAG